MGYSTTYIAIIVNLLSVGLPYLGLSIGDAQLTTTAQTIVAILTGLWVMMRRHKTGDISLAGIRK